MDRSESIANLAKALAAAQADFMPAVKSAENPFFHSKYANLYEVVRACRKPLAANGLATIQLVSGADGLSVTVETILTHASGEFVSASMTMVPKDQTPQAMGSLISYLRRYTLAALVNVVTDDDDDGNAANGRSNDNRPASKTKPKPEEPTPTNGETRTLKEAQAALNEAEAKPAPQPENERKLVLDAIAARMQALIRPDNPKKTALQKVLMSETFGAEKWSAVLQLPLEQLRAGLAKMGQPPAPTNGDGPAADIGF